MKEAALLYKVIVANAALGFNLKECEFFMLASIV